MLASSTSQFCNIVRSESVAVQGYSYEYLLTTLFITFLVPGHIEAIVRFANFERRASPQDIATAEVVYASQIGLDTIDELTQATTVTMYARFLWRSKRDTDAARAIFKTGEGKFCSRFYFSNYLKFEMEQLGKNRTIDRVLAEGYFKVAHGCPSIVSRR